jgi:hypothetical protein
MTFPVESICYSTSLFWVPVASGRWQIDWQRTNRAVAVF